MDDIMHILLDEADRMKNRPALKDDWQSQGKGETGSQTDEVLAVGASDGGNRKRRKGKCHYCGREGHWVRECCTKKGGRQNSSKTEQASSTGELGDQQQAREQASGLFHSRAR
jgi:hypothetical protein